MYTAPTMQSAEGQSIWLVDDGSLQIPESEIQRWDTREKLGAVLPSADIIILNTNHSGRKITGKGLHEDVINPFEAALIYGEAAEQKILNGEPDPNFIPACVIATQPGSVAVLKGNREVFTVIQPVDRLDGFVESELKSRTNAREYAREQNFAFGVERPEMHLPALWRELYEPKPVDIPAPIEFEDALSPIQRRRMMMDAALKARGEKSETPYRGIITGISESLRREIEKYGIRKDARGGLGYSFSG